MANINDLNVNTPENTPDAPVSPDYLYDDRSGGNKYKPKNKPLNNRVIIIIALVIVVMLFYIIMNIDNNQKSNKSENQIKIANIVGASDKLPFSENTELSGEEETNRAVSEDNAAVTLREDGTLGPPKMPGENESNAVGLPSGTEPAKRTVRIVQRPPTDSYRESRNKMIAALFSEAEVQFETLNENTSVNINNGSRNDAQTSGTGGEAQDWESIYRNSPLFTQNRGNGGGQYDTNAAAMAHQDRNDGFVSGNTGTRTSVADEYVPNTRRRPMGKYELKAGSIISGVMMGGINSDMPGTIVGQVSEHIYDTATGSHLLIPQGSRMVGTYDSHVVYGQNRILVVWERIVYPDGTSLNLEGMLGADQSGYAGFKQKIDNHYSRLIGAALFASVFVAAGRIATQDDENDDGSKTEAANAVMETMASLGARLAERNLNVAPTLRILPGYRFAIICTRDIAFAEPYIIP
jgi:type IV secretion system protein VirB10